MSLPETPAAERPKQASGSPWSIRIATVAGIPVRIHFTFFLFLLWIALIGRQMPTGPLMMVLLIVGVFFCVLLHEFGHALVAKRYGISTRDITLYPIGGVAMLEGRRPKAIEELWIALAGPLVNVAIAIVLGVALFATRGTLMPATGDLTQMGLLEALFIANVILPLFNMIPAFPMDGGRVLRALLGLSMPMEQATRIAGTIGQALAIGFGIFGLLSGHILLMLIAFFVYLGAAQEMAALQNLSMLSGHLVRDAMMTRFRTIQSGETLATAARMLLEGAQQDFPVVAGEEVIGLLTRSGLASGLAESGPQDYVAARMLREFPRIGPEEKLDRTMDLFRDANSAPVLVMEGDRLIGMITTENLSEFIMLKSAISQNRGV